LICLGFEWEIAGDDNPNASVQLAYRAAGSVPWKEALPLLRMGGERVFRDREALDYTVLDRFAGSILDRPLTALDYDIFEKVRPPERGHRHAVYHAGDPDFRLRPGGKAVDAGVRLPNVNDDFAGRAPDLGAYEAGQPVPVYGPRGRTDRQPFYR